MNEEKVKIKPLTDKLYEAIRGVEYGRLETGFYRSITIQGQMITLVVDYNMMPHVYNEFREHMMPRGYAEEICSAMKIKLPEHFEFALQFCGFNVFVVSYIERFF